MPLANPNVAVAATQMEILTMATKKKTTAKKTKTKKKTIAKKKTSKKKQSAITKAIVKKSTARKPRLKSTRPATKSKRMRVEGTVAALDGVLHGIGAERAERIRQRVRALLNSFR